MDTEKFLMQRMIRAVMEDGKIKLLEDVEIPEGTDLLVTTAQESEDWLKASERSLQSIWDNSEDDVYAALGLR